DVMEQFLRNRPKYQRDHIIDYFELSGRSQINFKIEEINSGSIRVNEVESVNENVSRIYFKNVPLTLAAVPNVGYEFQKWQGLPDSIKNPQTVNVALDSMTISAIFKPVSISMLPSTVSADTILTLTNSPFYASTNVTVDSNVTLQVEEGVEILMSTDASLIVYGRLLINGTQQKPVTIK
ncbi:MAG: hypothetical protein GY808_08000, partial [Gammaproteobacteria bacterium]|nr:hypothetical protein [Gammaproteobacteria bacterium]